jgi:hypothetical protein
VRLREIFGVSRTTCPLSQDLQIGAE